MDVTQNGNNAQGQSCQLDEEEATTLAGMIDPDAQVWQPALPAEKFQSYLVLAICQNPDVCQRLAHVPPDNLFKDAAHILGAKIAVDYFTTHGTVPTPLIAFETAKEMTAEKSDSDRIATRVAEIFTTAPKNPLDAAYVVDRCLRDWRANRVKLAGIDYTKDPTPENLARWKKAVAEVEAGSAGSRDKFRCFTMDELYSLPAPDWSIDKHFATDSMVCLFGPSGHGKTFCLIEMACCLATGMPFLGAFHVQKGPVLYIISEGQTGWKLRIKAWEKKHGVSVGKNLVVMPSAFNLLDETESSSILEAARNAFGGSAPKTIFVDTLARNFGSGDENSTKDMNKFINCCDWLRKETGGAVVMAHHTGREVARKERGNSALRGACDVMIEVSMKGMGANGIILVECSKQKDTEPFVGYHLEAEKITLDQSDLPKLHHPTTSLVWSIASEDKIEADAKEGRTLDTKILNILTMCKADDASDENTMTIGQLVAKTGETDKKLKPALTSLVDAGKVAILPGVKNRKGYFIPYDDKAWLKELARNRG